MTVPEAAIKILQEYPDGLSAKKVTDEILAHKLHPLPAKDPVQIVARAMNRHCIGIDRSYSCQDRFFTASKDNTGLLIYKLVPGTVPTVASIIGSFTFPRQQVLTINNSKGAKTGAKTRIMDAENQSVRDLLGKYCFHVPDYQRSYSWNSENIDEFLDDLFNVVHSTQADARHFLGAVTMAKRDEQHDAVDLIDGQQRMTTIFLFLYVILGQYRSARFADKATGRADELLRKLAYLNDDGERTGSRLVLGEFNRAFFDDFIIDGHNKSDEEKDNLSKYSSNIFTLNTFYTANKRIFKMIDAPQKAEKLIHAFWSNVVANMREWNEMDNGELSKKSLREDYITTQGLIILALGRLGEFYFANPKIDMVKSLKGLRKIDWLRNNEECWMNRAIKPNGKINRNEQGIFLTYIQIKRLLSLPIGDEELKKESKMRG